MRVQLGIERPARFVGDHGCYHVPRHPVLVRAVFSHPRRGDRLDFLERFANCFVPPTADALIAAHKTGQ